jgi:hypothetical protein
MTPAIAEKKIQTLEKQNYVDVPIGNAFNKGLEIFKKEWGMFLGFTLLSMIAQSIVSGLLSDPMMAVFSSLISAVIWSVCSAGILNVARKIHQGKSVQFSDFFQPFEKFSDYAISYIVGGLVTILGFFLFIIPGVYLSVCFTFVMHFILVYNVKPIEALKMSYRVVKMSWFSFFAFGLLMGLVMVGGVLALLVGVFFATPLISCCSYALFAEVVGDDRAAHISDEEFIGSHLVD